MSIQAECPECGKGYRVKDEMAGRRFRCQSCEALVTTPKPDDGDDPWEDDFMGGLDSAVSSEHRSASSSTPPVAGRKKPARGEKASRQKKAADAGGLATILKVLGTIVGTGVGFAVGYAAVSALMSGGFASKPSWQQFSPPAGTYQAEFPSVPKPRVIAGSTPGSQTYAGETRKFACAVTVEPFPPEVAGIDHAQLLDLLADNLALIRPGSSVTARQSMSFGEHTAMELSISVQAQGQTLSNTSRIIVTGDKVYTVEYVDDGSGNAADRDRFFRSFKLLDDAGQPQPASWSGASAGGQFTAGVQLAVARRQLVTVQ